MTDLPTETRTFDLDLSDEHLWVVHHRLVSHADRAIDEGDEPAPMVIDLVEHIEDGRTTLTSRQAETLKEELVSYLDEPQVPQNDEQLAKDVIEVLSPASA